MKIFKTSWISALMNIIGLGIAFAVFLILDQFNPMMNFIDNPISRWLLAWLCLCGITQSVLTWKKGENENEEK